MKQNRKRTKLKKSSCSLCKPHKKGWEDRRTRQVKKEDVKLKYTKNEILK